MRAKQTLCILLSAFSLLAEARECGPPSSAQARVRKHDFNVFQKLSDAGSTFEALYASGRRLAGRAFAAEGGEYVLDEGIVLPRQVIAAISSHISSALAFGYADYVFYPDMGHVHILIPDANPDALPAALNSKDVRFLYHTAELIKLKEDPITTGRLVDDPWLQWRYWTRNLVGSLDARAGVSLVTAETGFNTVRELNGFREATTLYFSASIDGCFTYEHRGQSFGFDIGL